MKISEMDSDRVGMYNHRGGIRECPFCDKKISCDTEGWLNPLIIREVILDRWARYRKPACVIVVSECPNCFKLSWIHERIRTLELFKITPELTKMLSKERIFRIKGGKKLWNRSKCKICKKLKSVDFYNYYPFITCPRIMGEATTENCKWYKNFMEGGKDENL